MLKYLLATILTITLNSYCVIINLTILRNPVNGCLIYIYSDIHQPTNKCLQQAEIINNLIKHKPYAKILLDSYLEYPIVPSHLDIKTIHYDVLLKCHNLVRSNYINVIEEDIRFKLISADINNQKKFLEIIEKLKVTVKKLQEQKIILSNLVAFLNNFKTKCFSVGDFLLIAEENELDLFDAQCLESILLNSKDKEHIIVCGLLHTLKIFDHLTRQFSYQVIYNANKKIEAILKKPIFDSVCNGKDLLSLYLKSFQNKHDREIAFFQSHNLKPSLNYKISLSDSAIEKIFGIPCFDELNIHTRLNKTNSKI